MHRRKEKSHTFGTTIAIVVLLVAAAHQLFTKVLPNQFSAESDKIQTSYDAAAAGEALDLFRGR